MYTNRQFFSWFIPFALVCFSVIGFIQCKESKQREVNSLLSPTNNTQYGVWVSGAYTLPFKNGVLDSLGLNTTLVEIRSTDTTWNIINYYTIRERNIQLNYLFNRRGESTVCFPATNKERQQYRDSLRSLLTVYRPTWLCVEREETNYYTGAVKHYQKELKRAKEVCDSFGVRVANGGLTTRDITLLIYRYYQDKGKTDLKKSWGERCVPDRFIKKLESRKDTIFEQSLLRLDSFVQAYRKIKCNAVNFHWYEPAKYRGESNPNADTVTRSSGALKEIVSYLKEKTKLPSICNEMGQINSRPELTLSMLQETKEAGLLYVGWFSGDMGQFKATSLYTPTGSLTETGKEFYLYLNDK